MLDKLNRRGLVRLAGLLAGGAIAPRAHGEEPEPLPLRNLNHRIDSAIEALDGLARGILKASGIPGMAVAVVRGGRTAFARGYGIRKIGEDRSVDADTVFQLASLSKSIAATVVARQVAAQIVRWDTPVIAHLPWFQLADPWIGSNVTLSDMFSHRSGLPEHAGDDLEDLGFDRIAVLERLRFLPVNGFRDTYAYTNFGLTAAAEAVAQASGKDWASLSRDVLYTPLGMTRTSSRFSDYESRSNRAVGHVKIGNSYQAHTHRNPDEQSPAGGVSSSANDLARWMSMVLETAQSKETVNAFANALTAALIPQSIIDGKPSTPAALPAFYGHGFRIDVSPDGLIQLNHSGAFTLGAGTIYVMIPALGVGIAVLTNAAPSGAAEELAVSFTDLIEYGHLRKDWYAEFSTYIRAVNDPIGDLVGKSPPIDPSPAAALSTYVGTYANSYFGTATIDAVRDNLFLTIGPRGMRFPLAHWQGDVFAVNPFGENQPAGSVSSVTFTRANNRAASEITIEYLNENKLGIFRRH